MILSRKSLGGAQRGGGAIKKPLQSRTTGKDDKVDDRRFSTMNALRLGRFLTQRQGRLRCGFSVRMCHGLGSKWEDDVFGCESCGSGSHFKWISLFAPLKCHKQYYGPICFIPESKTEDNKLTSPNSVCIYTS